MLKCIDIKSIFIIGVGLIIIGQVCEFDYLGVQVCKVLCEEGYKVVFVNSNLVMIMIDLNMVDVIYIELIMWEVVVCIIEKECLDVILLMMGGQIVLNCVFDLYYYGVFEKFGVELIGVLLEVIDKVEDCQKFKDVMIKIGFGFVKLGIVYLMEEVIKVYVEIMVVIGGSGYLVVICLLFMFGGLGGGIVYNCEEFEEICKCGFDLLFMCELLIEELLFGWKEYEMEVVCDCVDNCIIVCLIENFDLMGVYIGDLIMVVLVQMFIDKEYQILCNVLFVVLCEIGVDMGGLNVQFLINLKDGCMVVIEMNLCVLCLLVFVLKVIGFLIVKVVVKLVVGYMFDELKNEIIGGQMLVLFELMIDYVVMKILCFVFEKFCEVDLCLIMQMKLVGEVMVIGCMFQELFQKVLCGFEVGVDGFDEKLINCDEIVIEIYELGLDCIWYVGDVFCIGMMVEEIFVEIVIDLWFFEQIEQIILKEKVFMGCMFVLLMFDELCYLKQSGFFDCCFVKLFGVMLEDVCCCCVELNVCLVYKCVDMCVVEFVMKIVYMYLIYEEECEVQLIMNKKIMVLGGGLNWIGQGIEFDYCCVYVVFVMCEDGYEMIMVNCNLEMVLIDYDMFDCLYFELLMFEDVFEIVDKEKLVGVIVQYGGQMLLKFVFDFEVYGVLIVGMLLDMIDVVEDCECFQKLLQDFGLCQLLNCIVCVEDEVFVLVDEIGYLLVVCLLYVFGGCVMEIVYELCDFECYMCEVVKVLNDLLVLFDCFLNDVIECDVDCICDGEVVFIGGVMEYIEQVGVYLGDLVCLLLLYLLLKEIVVELKCQMGVMVKVLNVVGLMNVQFVIQQVLQVDGLKQDIIYVLEVNLCVLCMVLYVLKVISLLFVKIVVCVMVGQKFVQQGVMKEVELLYFSVKEVVFLFVKFLIVDLVFGFEMCLIGEVMGVGQMFGEVLFKLQFVVGLCLLELGMVLLIVMDVDKLKVVEVVCMLYDFGYLIVVIKGMVVVIEVVGVLVKVVNKVKDGCLYIVDMIKNGEIVFVFMMVDEMCQVIVDLCLICMSVQVYKVMYYMMMLGVCVVVEGLCYLKDLEVYDL